MSGLGAQGRAAQNTDAPDGAHAGHANYGRLHETRPHRRGDIQGLRAVAVIMVVAFHAELPFPGGFVGVDVFFVISGFVITSMLMREWAATGRIRFGAFYWRRFKRLTPALALLVCVTLLASLVVLSPLGPLELTAQTGLGAMLLAANGVIAQATSDYFAPTAKSNALLNTWSLSVEEQFYLVFPALLVAGLILGKKRGSGAKVLATLLLVVIVASFGVAVIGSQGGLEISIGGTLFGFYSPVTRAWEFAAGALLALLVSRLSSLTRGAATFLAATGFLGLVVAIVVIGPKTPFPGVWTLLPVGATVMLLAAGTVGNPISALLARRTPQVVGDWSYSIYLWHWPAIVLAVAVWPRVWWVPAVAAAISVMPAALSYRFVETPLRTAPVGRNNRSAAAKLAAGVMVPPLALALVVMWLPNLHPGLRELRESLNEPYPARSSGCEYVGRNGIPEGDACTWNASASGRPIILVGDSNADHFATSLIGVGVDAGRPVTLLINYSCPFGRVVLIDDANSSKTDECREFTKSVEDYLEDAPPSDVVIAATDTYWIDSRFAVESADSQTVHEPSARLSAFATGIGESVEKLTAAGHRVHLVQTVPGWRGDYAWDAQECNITTWLSGRCKQQAPVAQMALAQEPVRNALSSVARATKADVIDPWPWVCSDDLCETETGELKRYRDPLHLTVSQARLLTDEFSAALAPG